MALSWPAPFVLQSATNLAGPYADVPGASSPWSTSFSQAKQSFFRLRSQPFRLASTGSSAGQFRLDCPGIPGCNFVIQASTNLATWMNLQTNSSPFVFTDTQTSQYYRRFYRAVLAH